MKKNRENQKWKKKQKNNKWKSQEPKKEKPKN